MNDAGTDGGTQPAADPDRARAKRPRRKLVGTDGNVFSIIGRVRWALSDAGERDLASEFVQWETIAGS